MIHVDTSFIIRTQVPGTPEDAALREWIHAGETLGVSAPAWAEFLCGPATPGTTEAAAVLVQTPLPFEAHHAVGAARLFNSTGRRRGSLVECMIAATAIEAGARLATANPRDFLRFEALGLELAIR